MAILPRALSNRLMRAFFDHPTPTGISDITLLTTQARQMDELLQLNWTRRVRYNDFDKMDKGYLAPVLDSIAVACTRFRDRPMVATDILEFPRGFKVQLDGYGSRGPRQVIAQVLADTRIKDKSYDYVRNLVKYGDIFAEILFAGGDSVLGVQRYLSPQIWVNKDPKGFFLPNDPVTRIPQAYQQKEMREGPVIAGFEPWQMIHWKFQETDVHAYSEKSLFDDMRDDWWKLSFEEQALVIARITRAFPRTIHTLDMTGKTDKDARKQLQEYANQMTRKQTRGGDMIHSAQSPDEDMFRTTQYHNPNSDRPVPKLDKVEFYDPKLEGLANIDDIKYLRGKLFTRIPAELIGITDSNFDGITAQDLAFVDLCEYVTWRYEVGVRQLLDTALFLKGYRDVSYRISFPMAQISSNWKNADAQYRRALADQLLYETGSRSLQEILRREGRTDEEIARILDEVEANRKRFGDPNQKASQRSAGMTQT